MIATPLKGDRSSDEGRSRTPLLNSRTWTKSPSSSSASSSHSSPPHERIKTDGYSLCCATSTPDLLRDRAL
ncbi:hypothetical protein [Vacuolonema iberomarrocanum]|uniref:hypothetical protein n=1 Tax=Vacuolonema iberomarrocanum TaxID=3454632 RepID=UPI0019D8E36E|nr:hypothetical protein [filamentous cyanobacterium LEGE 07170]